MSAILDDALALIEQGCPDDAEQLVRRHAEQVGAQHGVRSHAYADALIDVAQILAAVGRLPAAAEVLRTAAGIPAEGEEERKSRLTILMNLGDLLARMGELVEAEAVAREGLEGRRALYGPTHAGYAFGLEPLAEILLLGGRAGEALPLAEEAVDILWEGSHPKVLEVLPLRAFARHAVHGADAPGFEGFEELPDDLRERAVDAARARAARHVPSWSLPALDELRGRVAALDAASRLLPAIDGNIAAIARLAGLHELRAAALLRCREAYESQGEPGLALGATQRLALAHAEAGDADGATQLYADAATRAEVLGDAALQSSVARDFGQHLEALGAVEAAEAQLRAAVARAEASGAKNVLGRALVALGCFAAHQGHPEDAAALLVQALEALAPEEPDVLTARSYLAAIEQGLPCVPDLDLARSEVVTDLVHAQLPAGLVGRVAVRVDEDGVPQVDAELLRPLSIEEQHLLDAALQNALLEVERRSDISGYPGV